MITQQNHHSAAAGILDAVRAQFGITFKETCTGGGCMALEARLESGHWIVATDEGLLPFEDRVAYEAEERALWADEPESARAMGWAVFIYEHDEEDDTWMQPADEAFGVWDETASADMLPDMVSKALQKFVSTIV